MSVYVVFDESAYCAVYLLAAEALADKYHRVNHLHRNRCQEDHCIQDCPFYERVKVVRGDFLDV